jgi:hypothetical protein
MNKIGAAIFTLCILIASASAQTDSRIAARRLGNCITAHPIPTASKAGEMAVWTLTNICSQTIHVFWGGTNIDPQDAELPPGSDYKNALIAPLSPHGTDAMNWVACPSDYSPPDSAKLMGWSPENFDLDVCVPGYALSVNEHPSTQGTGYPVSPVRVAPSIRLPPP